MSAQPSKAMIATVKRLVDANDLEGLRDLYGKLRVATEKARMVFNRNNSVKNGARPVDSHFILGFETPTHATSKKMRCNAN